MMPRKSTSVRLSPSAERKLEWLAERFENQSTAIEVAIDRLYQTERRAGPGAYKYDPSVSYTVEELFAVFSYNRTAAEWLMEESTEEIVRNTLDLQGVTYDDDLVRSLDAQLRKAAEGMVIAPIRRRIHDHPGLERYEDIFEDLIEGAENAGDYEWLLRAPVATLLKFARDTAGES